MLPALALAALAAFAAPVAALARYCDGTNSICVTAGTDLSGIAYFTVQCAATGWCAIGTGSRMAGSSMYMGWKNSTGGMTFSARQSGGHSMPSYSPSSDIAQITTPPEVPAVPWAALTYSFKRPLAGGVTLSATSRFIYAWSSSAPSDPDSPSSSFSEHRSYGYITNLDVTTSAPPSVLPVVNVPGGNGTNSAGTPTPPSQTNITIVTGGSPDTQSRPILTLPENISYDMILRAHGIILVVAWLVCPAAGIFIARYLKFALGVWWFRLHVFFLFVGTGLLTIAGIVLIYLYKAPPHLENPHEILGFTVGIAMLLQIILGVVSDRLFDPKRTSTPIQDILHWWMGRIVVVLAIVNLFLGLNLYGQDYPLDKGYLIALGVVVGVIALAFVAGQFLIGQQHHDASTDDKFSKQP
ncbi:hypothetical protein HK105_206965 [Polyrhizophydium stewartii]|uniref:Cytochrome b561 domain-containing protein n=1 Tax=Polyrhizophydium stewartii TaxID=2732419 RepID=A0ABR4N1W8_9FUNG